MTILIPAYNPDERLLRLISALADSGCRLIVVDNGSGEEFRDLFKKVRSLGAHVLSLDGQTGAGAAYRAGFLFAMETGESQGVVCADWTGEYSPQDILRLCSETGNLPKDTILLGVRRFTGNVPPQIRAGSLLARKIFAFALGKEIEDMQTALRGYPAHLLPWLAQVPGGGLNYLTNILLDAPKSGLKISQLEIKTEWKDTSLPWPARDSLASFLPLILFCLSGTLEAGIAYTLLFLILAQSGNLLFSTVAARVASSGVNFSINKLLVFKTAAAHRTPRELFGYYCTYALLMLANYLCLSLFYETLRIPILWSVLMTECILFLISYTMQNRVVFAKKGGPKAAGQPSAARRTRK